MEFQKASNLDADSSQPPPLAASAPFDHDLALLDCATARGLITSQQARAVAGGLAGRSAAVALVQEAGLSMSQVRALLNHQRRRSPSQVVEGYRLQRELGRGGMAIVYAARAIDPALMTAALRPQEVAIKILSRKAIRRRGGLDRFLREIRAAEQVAAPGIVRTLGSGTIIDRPYLIMELMPEGDLEGELLRGRSYSIHEVLEIAIDVCRGAQAIADAGWVHRDLKPSNLFRDETVGIKIGDLGLAKEMMDPAGLTLTGETVGTPEYMAPEQVSGEACDVRWDVYALGVTMFQLTTGEVPFSGPTQQETMRQVLVQRGRKLHLLRPQVDPDFAAVIATAMAKDPRRRYQTPEDLGQDCARLLAGERPRLMHRRFNQLRRSA